MTYSTDQILFIAKIPITVYKTKQRKKKQPTNHTTFSIFYMYMYIYIMHVKLHAKPIASCSYCI